MFKNVKRLMVLAAAAAMMFVTVPTSRVHAETASTTDAVPMYRLYNLHNGEHFYTRSANEKNQLSRSGWKYEGIAWYAPKNSGDPVYRLYNPNVGDHHYTTSAYEKDYLIKYGWRYEGIGWNSDSDKEVPVYRQYNPNAVSGSHNYTTSAGERDSLVRSGWKDEGIGWYGVNPGSTKKKSDSKSDSGNKNTDSRNTSGRKTTTDSSVTERLFTVSNTDHAPSTNVGDWGNFSIPDLGIDVAVYDADHLTGGKTAQDLIDAENSAQYCSKYYNVPEIADHANQAFVNLKDAAGHYAYVTHNGVVTRFMCTDRKVAHLENGNYRFSADSDLTGASSIAMESKIGVVHGGDFIARTCQDDTGEWIFALLFNKQ